MPQPALIGTYPLPGVPGATVTAGLPDVQRQLSHIFRNGPVTLAEDIETFGLGLDALRLKCVTLATPWAAVVLDPRMPGDRAELLRAQDYASVLVMNKANFDAPNLALNDLFPAHLVDKVVDTVLLKRLALPGDRKLVDLDAMAKHYLGLVGGKILDLFRSLGYKTKKEGFLKLDIDAPSYLFGAGADGVVTARLLPILHRAAVDRQLNHPFGGGIGLNRSEAEEMIAERHEHNRWAIEAQIRGLLIDVEYLENYRRANQAGMERDRAYLHQMGIGNANHLVSFLDQIGALPPGYRRTDTGKLGTAADDLQALNHPLATMWAGKVGLDGKVITPGITQLEKLDGYLQKCVDMSSVDGRIHPATDVLKAAHGRDAMADPPLHQFPELARPIVAFDEDGTSTDWSQQEPRLAFNFAGDIGKPLLDYENYGVKIYKGIAEFADITIDGAKIVVLAGLYGRGLEALNGQLGLSPEPWIEEEVWSNGTVREARWGYEAAKDVQRAVFSAIPMTEQYMNNGKRIARDHGVAWTMAGRIVPIPSGFYKGRFSVQAHKWINYNVSGSANDEISRVIVQARRMGMGHLVWLGMHDELIHATRISGEIRQLMETPSERLCHLAKRRPVIRTDQARLGMRWGKPE